MIIDAEYIRRYRPLARNIADERVAIYIDEAEKLDLLPAIGAELYQRFASLGQIAVDDCGAPLSDEEGTPIYALREGDLPTAEHKLLNGGYYTDGSGCKHQFEGLRTALAYLAYGRFVRNHAASVTPYGVVTKLGEDSTPADARTVASVASDATRIGQEHLAAALRYWQSTGADGEECRKAPAARRKIVCIAS
ncbi:MAG: hypothetical protein K2K83_05490 [Rikenella sp.]|nr:hypothetical protein [Rikenella sp.]